jgi:hypothetical protein
MTNPTPVARAIRTGWYSCWNWGTPKSNSAWNVDSPTTTTPARRSFRNLTKPGLCATGAASRSNSHMPSGVNDAPEIISRCVGPHIVTSTP